MKYHQTVRLAQRDLEEELRKACLYLKSLTRGTAPPKDLAPQLKAKIDALVLKHTNKP